MLKKIPQLEKNKFKYLIIGANGLLGSALKKKLSKKQTLCIARNNSDINLNLENFHSLNNIFNKFKFDNVINCVAVTNLEYCDRNKRRCKKINLTLPIKLAYYSQVYKFKLVHISTDQVYFSKKKNQKNKETDKTAFFNFYSKTKYKSEQKIKKLKNSLIIRTNFTGFKKKIRSTFVGWIYKSIQENKKINLYEDMYVSTLDANTCAHVIKKLLLKKAKGIFNVGTNTSISKKDFALYFAKKIKRKILYNSVSNDKSKLFRPKYLALNVKKVEKKIKLKMISPKKSINNLVKEISNS